MKDANETNTGSNAVAIGRGASADDNCYAFGNGASAKNGGIAIGHNVTADGEAVIGVTDWPGFMAEMLDMLSGSLRGDKRERERRTSILLKALEDIAHDDVPGGDRTTARRALLEYSTPQ